MKILKVFALFVLLHAAGWAGAHVWMSGHPTQVLVVVDTSYAMKPKFPAVEAWIQDYAAGARYQTIRVGTDKAMLGPLDELKSYSVIFRTAFGRMETDNLQRYQGVQASQKILLSDGSVQPDGWQVISF
ncbi:MAG: hypothetical protein R3E95_05255 [Thiolinea sp.]